jgi:hypothetical protein
MAIVRRANLLSCALCLSCANCALAQVTSPLKVVKDTVVPREIHDIVAVGGPNEGIQCDSEENLWMPGVRGYSSTVSSLVRFRPNAAAIHIDIDRDRRLNNGSIEYFLPLRDGGVLALVRTVAEYNEIDGDPTTPKRYADTFAVTFGPLGTISSITQLRVPPVARKVTAVAQLKNGWLVAGYTSGSTSIDMQAYLFDPAGNLTKEIMLPGNRNKSSRQGTVGSMAILRPTAFPTMDGNVVVLRGFSNQPFYRFSGTGELLETTKLRPDGIEFWSPRLVGDSLFVSAGVEDEKIGDMGGIPIVRPRSAFSIFDLKTGQITEVLTWMDHGIVGCFNGKHLLIVKQGDFGTDTWRILTLERTTPKTHPPGS